MNQEIRSVPNYHKTFKGSSYEIGQQTGEMIADIPEGIAWWARGKDKLSAEKIKKINQLMNEHCPGLPEELQGIADTIKLPVNDLYIYFLGWLQEKSGHCSQFAIHGDFSANGQPIMARNYEFALVMDDFTLATTHINGKYKHTGFTILYTGRFEGMNEHGLSISMTASGRPVGMMEEMASPAEEGLNFYWLVRAVLENCKTCEEAYERMAAYPLGSNNNFLVMDAAGKAFIMEGYASRKGFRWLHEVDSGSLICTNHYVLKEMQGIQDKIMVNAPVRWKKIESFINEHKKEGVSIEQIKDFMANVYPDGPSVHFYEEFFGTLRCLIFEPASKQMHICFGSPTKNGWYTLDAADPQIPAQINAKMPLAKSTSEFWAPVKNDIVI